MNLQGKLTWSSSIIKYMKLRAGAIRFSTEIEKKGACMTTGCDQNGNLVSKHHCEMGGGRGGKPAQFPVP